MSDRNYSESIPLPEESFGPRKLKHQINSWDGCPNPPVYDWRSIDGQRNVCNISNNSYRSHEVVRGHQNTNTESYCYTDYQQSPEIQYGHQNPNTGSYYYSDYQPLSREVLYGYDDPSGVTTTTSSGSGGEW